MKKPKKNDFRQLEDCLGNRLCPGDYILFEGTNCIGEKKMVCGKLLSASYFEDPEISVFGYYRIIRLNLWSLKKRALKVDAKMVKKFQEKES